MNITAFYPAILTSSSEKVIASFERMGFSIIHQRSSVFGDGEKEYVLENETKQRVDIVLIPEFEEDVHAVRVNVTDFDEALKTYYAEGFSVVKGPALFPDSKNVLLHSPSNLLVMVMQHIQND